METGGVVKDWNIYSPRWCPVEITRSPLDSEKVLMLQDFDPYDYAKAVRVFQPAEKNRIRFKLFIESNPEILAMEVVTANGARCVQTRLDTDGKLLAKNGIESLAEVSVLESGKWIPVEFDIHAKKQWYHIRVNEETVAEKVKFSAEGIPERIIFRTGKYRLTDDVQKWKSGDKFVPGWDEPGADETVPKVTYYLKDFSVSSY
jgi:hypothetical protein